MRALYETGQFTQQQLAERFGCDQTYVSLIVRGQK
jgi:transcriptional regulator with XRE-family HTH domain